MMYTNVFYFHTLNSIGGIETFFYQLGKKYGKDYDITIFFRNGDPGQVKRLSELVRVKKFKDGMRIRCKRMFVCFNTDILDAVESDEYWQMLHGDYVSLGVYPMEDPKITKWIAVSDVVRGAYMDGKDRDSIVCYNPFVPTKPKKVLNLISATRLTPDKGSVRMQKLIDALEAAGIPFLWTIYSDSPKPFNSENVIVCKPRLDIIEYIANADYLVQLSDSEGYCYSIVEALSVGTPVIVSDFKVAKEIGVENGKNGFILPMDMSDIPVKEIYKGLKKFTYKPPEDHWGDLLLAGGKDYEAEMNEIVTIVCKRQFFDLERNKMVDPKEVWEVPRRRAELLYELDVIDILE